MNKIFSILLFLTVLTVVGSLLSLSAAAASNVSDNLTVESVDGGIMIESIDEVSVSTSDEIQSAHSDEASVSGSASLNDEASVSGSASLNDDEISDFDSSDVANIHDGKKSSSSKKLSAGKTNPFKILSYYINERGLSEINLDSDYVFNKNTDSDFKDGIVIGHDLTINGNGHTLDGSRQCRIFKINGNAIKVVFNNINFINGATWDIGGAAILGNCTAVNCTFRNNDFGYVACGGAMYGGCAINCIFEDNNYYRHEAIESQGGAMYGGSAINCIFRHNGAAKGGAVANSYVENCTFEENRAGNWAGAMLGGFAKGCTFIRNDGRMSGGAINYGNAENCTFIENKAGVGSAMADGSAVNCVFMDNIADWGGSAIQWGNATLCIFNNDTIGETAVIVPALVIANAKAGLSFANQLIVNIQDANRNYDGVKIILNVYKDDVLVGTYHALSGDVCILDLDAGVYNVLVSIEGIPEVQYVESTIMISNPA